MNRIIYFFSKTVDSVLESPGTSVLTSATIGAALLLMAGYTMALQNIERLALVWGRTSSMSVYLSDGLETNEWTHIRAELEALEPVELAELVTPQEALERFRARGEAAAELVEGVSVDLLPASVQLRLRAGFADLDAMAQLAQDVSVRHGVDAVDFGQEEFERLKGLLRLFRYGGAAIGLLLALTTAFIVSNTIRLTVYTRREEITILRLVGATNWFIRAPFLFEGAVWGLAGSLGAGAVLIGADQLLAPWVSEIVADILGGLTLHFFAPDVGAAVVILGVGLGMAGSALAVRRFLDVGAV